MLQYPTVLLLSASETEGAVLRQTLSEHVIVTPADNPSDAIHLLESNQYDALLCMRSLDSGTWGDIVETVRDLYPGLPVINIAGTAEERQWMEMLDTGTFDILLPSLLEPKPASVAAGWHDRMNGQAGACDNAYSMPARIRRLA
jgi:DNA-binding NtrC family response regulator